MAVVGFIGLGVMGGPMAGHLVKKGFPTIVWNRTPAKCRPLAQIGASVADDPTVLARQSDVIVLCVNTSEDVLGLLGDLLPSCRPGTVIVDHSTISPSAAVQAHEACGESVAFLDAPITGGSMGAVNGTLTVFCGGSEASFQVAKPVVSAYAKRIEVVGGPGSGQLTKAANQIAVGGALLGLCESLAFAKAAGLDLALTRDLLSTGAAGSWAFDNYGPKILARDWSPGFSCQNQRKDFAYVMEAAQQIGATVPGTELVDHLLAQLTDAGQGGLATAALYAVMAKEDLGP